MMAGLAQPIQRIVALALLAAAILTGLAALDLAVSTTTGALRALDQARGRAARVEALRDRPSPPEVAPIPPGLTFRAPTHEAAAALATARIGAMAAQGNLVPQPLAAEPQDAANPGLVRISFAIEGEESRILTFVNDVERDTPVLRLRAWRISRIDGESPRLRLEATAVAAWEAPQ